MGLAKEEHDMLDCTYPPSFVSTSCSEPFVCLPLLSHNDLLSCVQRSQGSIPNGCRTKTAYIKLIENNDTVRVITWLAGQVGSARGLSMESGTGALRRYVIVLWAEEKVMLVLARNKLTHPRG